MRQFVIGSLARESESIATIEADDLQGQIYDLINRDVDRPAVIILSHLNVNGDLYLNNLNIDERGVPNFKIINCRIAHFDVSNSTFKRFEIQSSTINSLNGYQVRCQYDFNLNGVIFLPQKNHLDALNLHGADIGGGFIVKNCRVNGDVHICGCELGRELLISKSNITGGLCAANTKIRNHFNFDDCKVSYLRGKAISFSGEGVQIGGALLWTNIDAAYEIGLLSASVGINIEFKRCNFRGGIVLINSSLNGSFWIKEETQVNNYIACLGMRVGGSVEIDRSTFRFPSQKFYGFNLSQSSISGSIILKDNNLFSGMNLSHIVLAGNLVIRGNSVEKRDDMKFGHFDQKYIDLSHSNVSGQIDLELLPRSWLRPKGVSDAQVEAVIFYSSLANARVGNLELRYFGNQKVIVDLQNFESKNLVFENVQFVERFSYEFFENANSWLDRHGVIALQPFRHLAHHLLNGGWSDQSDEVTLRMRRLYCRSLKFSAEKIFLKAYDTFFNYGYGKLTSLITLFLWIAIGSVGTQWALQRNVLIVKAQPVVAAAIQQPGQPLSETAFLTLPTSSQPSTSVPCGTSIEPVFFAIELILPIFDLGQKDECTIRTPSPNENSFIGITELKAWWFAKYVYTIVGWFITTLTGLTLFGALRHRGAN